MNISDKIDPFLNKQKAPDIVIKMTKALFNLFIKHILEVFFYFTFEINLEHFLKNKHDNSDCNANNGQPQNDPSGINACTCNDSFVNEVCRKQES